MSQCHDLYGAVDRLKPEYSRVEGTQCHDLPALVGGTHDPCDMEEQRLPATPELATVHPREVVVLPSRTTIAEAARALTDAGASAVLLGPQPHRIVTERDVVRGLAAGLRPTDRVGSVASPAPLWVTPTSRVSDAARMMLRHEVRHLLVLRPTGEVAGLLAAEDLLPALAEAGVAAAHA